MRKLVLSLSVISAMIFASCSNQSNTSGTTTDSTNTEVVDSLEMSLDSMDHSGDSIITDSIQ